MKPITNKTLWSKAGFVEFADRDAAVAFYEACRSRNLAVYGGKYQSEATDWSFYYIAKAAGYPEGLSFSPSLNNIAIIEGRINDYASYIEATCNDEESGFPVTPVCGLLALDAEAPTNAVLGGVTKVAPFFSTRIDPIHHCPLN